ncbi:MAG: peptidase M50, partial [Halobacteria archaeon]|nr:peptidase M50 [Halobacteria archaeon]
MRNFTITRIWGIPIQINISLLLFLPILAWLIGSGGQIEFYSGVISGLTGEPLSVPATSTATWTVGILAAVGLF